MPGGDRSGPLGAGPMTGRALGFCAGFGGPGFMYPGPGRGAGFGPGFGGGRGRRFRGAWFAPWGPPAYGPWPHPAMYYGYGGPTRQQESEMLQSQIDSMEEALEELKQRQAELERERQKSGTE